MELQLPRGFELLRPFLSRTLKLTLPALCREHKLEYCAGAPLGGGSRAPAHWRSRPTPREEAGQPRRGECCAQARGFVEGRAAGGHVGAGGSGAARDPPGLGEPRVHRGDHQLDQEDRGLPQLLR